MTEPINLQQLRDKANYQPANEPRAFHVTIQKEALFALLATAEAATNKSLWYAIARLIEQSHLPTDHPARIAVARLRETLRPYQP